MQGAPRPARETPKSDARERLSFRLIVPAHNEETVINRCLESFTAGYDGQSRMDIVVVANGCTDRTAAIARSFGAPVRVIETDISSKSQAINLGLEGLGNQPCLIADADIECGFSALHATARALATTGVSAASPQLRISMSDASPLVCAYYRVWSALPYARDRLIGGGVYGLSADAVNRMGPLPDIIADDLYVRSQFAFGERRTVRSDRSGNEVFVAMFPPHNVRDLIAIEARRWRGSRDIRNMYGSGQPVAKNGLRSLMSELGKSFNFLELVNYSGIKLAGRALALFHIAIARQTWSRDMSSRASQ